VPGEHGNWRGGIVTHAHGVDSETGGLRTVLVHRPGAELRRMSPRCQDRMLLHRLPWVDRAQREHDLFTEVLRGHGVEVLYLAALLQEALEYQAARDAAIGMALAGPRLGQELRTVVREHLKGLEPEELAQVLIAGLAPGELRGGRGVVFDLMDRRDFIVEPLPNLVFTRDASAWISNRVVVSSLAAPGRAREAALLGLLYRHHPRFGGPSMLYGPHLEPLAGGDLVLLGPGVLAVGITAQTLPAAVERLSRQVLRAGLVHRVLAVPLDRAGAASLDTVCTVVGTGTLVMPPAVAYLLTAHTITIRDGELRVSRAQPFLAAAAEAIGASRITVIDTGLAPLATSRGQWDDGGNALSLGRGVALCDERNTETNTRLRAAGIQVIPVPSAELSSRRGGPRGMACAVHRDPASTPAREPDGAGTARGRGHDLAPPPRTVPALSNPHGLRVHPEPLAPAR
jgi:arginine deiminase